MMTLLGRLIEFWIARHPEARLARIEGEASKCSKCCGRFSQVVERAVIKLECTAGGSRDWPGGEGLLPLVGYSRGEGTFANSHCLEVTSTSILACYLNPTSLTLCLGRYADYFLIMLQFTTALKNMLSIDFVHKTRGFPDLQAIISRKKKIIQSKTFAVDLSISPHRSMIVK